MADTDPSLGDKVVAAGVALKHLATAIVTGGDVLVPRHVQQQRIKLCEACPHFNKSLRNCNKCSCFMDGKTMYAGYECADDDNRRWSAYIGRVPTQGRVLTVEAVLDKELELRQIFDPEHDLIQTINAYRVKAATCSSCAKNSLSSKIMKALVKALSAGDALVIDKVHAIFSQYTHVPDRTRNIGVAWASFTRQP